MNILEEFYQDCKSYGFEVVFVASGMAFIRDKYGEVIITLPRGSRSALSSRLYREVRARSRRGRFADTARAPEKPLASPASLMTWEEYNAKFDGADSREETGS